MITTMLSNDDDNDDELYKKKNDVNELIKSDMIVKIVTKQQVKHSINRLGNFQT